MNNKRGKNWFIQYDQRTFQFIQNPKIGDQAYELSREFCSQQGIQNEGNSNVSPWINSIADSVRDILQLLYNFFYVQQKLNQKKEVKHVFLRIYTLLQVQYHYSSYFFAYSEQFRLNRILASCIRLNRFLQAIFKRIESIKKDLDPTLIQNFQQVFLYMQQKIKQTLKKSSIKGDHQLNIIMLDMLSLILRNSGDPTMHKILDVSKQNRIMNNIQKSNEIYQQFTRNKEVQRKQYQKNRYHQFQNQIQQDPNKLVLLNGSQISQDY